MTITFEDFTKLDIRLGKVVEADRIEGADKLLKLVFDFGEEGKRQILAGIAESHKPEELVGKQMPVIINLEPRKMRGLESQGMILAADDGGKPVLLGPEEPVKEGSKVK